MQIDGMNTIYNLPLCTTTAYRITESVTALGSATTALVKLYETQSGVCLGGLWSTNGSVTFNNLLAGTQYTLYMNDPTGIYQPVAITRVATTTGAR